MSENILSQIDKVVKKKKKAQPKPKGKLGETFFATKLSEVSGYHFHRIYTSGASVGKSNNSLLTQLTQNQAESQLGDIFSPEDLTHYFIWECKNYAELDFHNLINNGSTKIHEWIEELEYDLQSAFTLLKDNYREIAGFLCVKITRKGSWIVGNKSYILKTFFENNIDNMKFNNVLFFKKECNEVLKKYDFNDEYFMTDFESFITLNKEKLFVVDEERKKRIEQALKLINRVGKR